MLKKLLLAITAILIATANSPAAKADSAMEFEAGEVLVVNPPTTFSAEISGQGYTVLETVILDGMGMELKRLEIPASMSVSGAIESLHQQFPDLEVNANYIVELTTDKLAH